MTDDVHNTRNDRFRCKYRGSVFLRKESLRRLYRNNYTLYVKKKEDDENFFLFSKKLLKKKKKKKKFNLKFKTAEKRSEEFRFLPVNRRGP